MDEVACVSDFSRIPGTHALDVSGGTGEGLYWYRGKNKSPVIETFCTSSRIHRRPSYFSAYYSFLEISRMIYTFSGRGIVSVSLRALKRERTRGIERDATAALNVPVIKQAIANDFVSTVILLGGHD